MRKVGRGHNVRLLFTFIMIINFVLKVSSVYPDTLSLHAISTISNKNEVVVDENISMIALNNLGINMNQSVTWNVIDLTGSAKIDEQGLLTGVSEGEVSVRATDTFDPKYFIDTNITITPKVNFEIRINNVIGVGESTFAIDEDNYLWVWGKNDSGQLGDGTNIHRFTPVKTLSNIKTVFGYYFGLNNYEMIAQKYDGTVWGWGGYYGNVPILLSNNVLNIYRTGNPSNRQSIYLLKDDKTLWSFGYEEYGMLGNGAAGSTTTPTMIIGDVKEVSGPLWGMGMYVIRNDGTLWGWGTDIVGDGSKSLKLSPTRVPLNDVVAVTAENGAGVFALLADGTVWNWGWSYDAAKVKREYLTPVQIPFESPVKEIFPEFALTTDGKLWSWGYNTSGELGIGTGVVYQAEPIQVMENVKEFHEFRTDGLNGQRAYAIKDDNTLWAWGYNERGVLGAGDSIKIYTPQQVLSDVVRMKIEHHTVYAIDSSNRLWYWGTIAQFPTTLVNGSSNSPIPNTPTLFMDNAIDVDGLLDQNAYHFDSHLAILGTDNQVYTYGSNYYGQLGTRDTANNYAYPERVDFQERTFPNLQVVGDNVTGVPVAYNQRLEVRFNTDISATRDFSGVALMDQGGQPVAIEKVYVDGNTIFVEPGELEYGKTYTLVVPKNAVYDKTGFNERISGDYSAMFVTDTFPLIFDEYTVEDGKTYSDERIIKFEDGSATLNGVNIASGHLV
ncbi:MAG: Ig-like domain-containing protein, partial [Youngiibacter sp.]|nr:Ig-like domain-containing protein [Youngiibacter sp.]